MPTVQYLLAHFACLDMGAESPMTRADGDWCAEHSHDQCSLASPPLSLLCRLLSGADNVSAFFIYKFIVTAQRQERDEDERKRERNNLLVEEEVSFS